MMYDAYVLRVIDGDTIECAISLGFGISITRHIRLYGIDAPEKNTPEGVGAKNKLTLLVDKEHVQLNCLWKTDKYGRVLATPNHNGVNICELLLKEGFAKPMLYSEML